MEIKWPGPSSGCNCTKRQRKWDSHGPHSGWITMSRPVIKPPSSQLTILSCYNCYRDSMIISIKTTWYSTINIIIWEKWWKCSIARCDSPIGHQTWRLRPLPRRVGRCRATRSNAAEELFDAKVPALQQGMPTRYVYVYVYLCIYLYLIIYLFIDLFIYLN